LKKANNNKRIKIVKKKGRLTLKIKKAIILVISILMLTSLLAGCGTNQQVDTIANEAVEKPATRIVQHKMGETEIPAEPKRIFVTLQRIADPMFALGVKPHAITAYGDVSYLGDKLEGVKVFDFYPINMETVLSEEPDLIVADPWIDQETYEKFSKIAPTVVIDGEGWRDYFPNVAKVLDKEAEYEEWMKEYDKKAASIKNELAKKIGEETVMVLRVQQDLIMPWNAQGTASKVLFEDLGLKAHQKVSDEWLQISLEALPEFDADHIFLEVRSTTEGSQKYFDDHLKDSSIWNNMKAVKNGNVYPITTDLWVEGDGPIGRDKMIDEVAKYLLEK